MELTEHQNEKANEIIHQLNSGRKRIILQASAGFGKTFLASYLIKNSKARGITVAAPTHKALSVLREKIEEKGNISFSTLHSALKLKLKYGKNGEKSFQQSFSKKDPPFQNCQILFLDEASMVNTYLLKFLEQYDFPIIFIADNKQLNPVKELISPVFDMNWYIVSLLEPIRQKEGNPILDLSLNLPLLQEKKPVMVGETGYLFTTNRIKIIHELSLVNGTDDLKYLAWTNAEVDSINHSVRKEIYGDPALIEQGESLVLNSRYVINKKEILHNNFELIVEDLSIEEKTFHCIGEAFTYKVYLINRGIYAVHEDYISAHKKNVSKLKGLAISKVIGWKDYYQFSEKFLDFKYNHAITVHKSQGSTYKDVIINIKDIKRNRKKEEVQRLLYTAITRASRKVVLYNV